MCLMRVSLCRLTEARVPFCHCLCHQACNQNQPGGTPSKTCKNPKDRRGSAWAGCLKNDPGMMVSGASEESTPSAWAKTRPDLQGKRLQDSAASTTGGGIESGLKPRRCLPKKVLVLLRRRGLSKAVPLVMLRHAHLGPNVLPWTEMRKLGMTKWSHRWMRASRVVAGMSKER